MEDNLSNKDSDQNRKSKDSSDIDSELEDKGVSKEEFGR